MAKEIQDVFTAQKADLQTETSTHLGGMIIYNTGMANVKLGHNLSELLGIGTNLMFMTFVKRLTSPSTYFVHCDLIDKKQNLLNVKPSTVVAIFDIRGQPFEKVNYNAPNNTTTGFA